MKVSLKNIVSPSLPLAVLMVLATIMLWVISFILINQSYGATANSIIIAAVDSGLHLTALSKNIINIVLVFLNVFLIAQLNNKFTIIRTRTFLPVVLFMLLMASWHDIHLAIYSNFALTLMIISFFSFFDMYRNVKASEQAFLGSLLIALGSLFVEPLILFIPVCWVGFIRFYSFSMRTWLASVFGTFTPWVLFVAYLVYSNQYNMWLSALPTKFEVGLSVLHLELNQIIYALCLMLISVIGLVGLYSNLHSDSIQTRAKLNFLIFIMVSAFIFSMIFSNYFVVFLPFVAMTFSVILSHPFTLKSSNFYGIIFVVFVFVNIAFMISTIVLQ